MKIKIRSREIEAERISLKTGDIVVSKDGEFVLLVVDLKEGGLFSGMLLRGTSDYVPLGTIYKNVFRGDYKLFDGEITICN